MTRDFLSGSEFLIIAPSAPIDPFPSIVNAIIHNATEGRRFLTTRYLKGLSCLINRHCQSNSAAYCDEVFDAIVSAVLRREIINDHDLPSRIRSVFRSLLLKYVALSTKNPTGMVDDFETNSAKEISELRRQLSVLQPVQREALLRLYVNGESVDSICADLGMDRGQFNLTRKLLRQTMRFAAENCAGPKKRPFSVIRKEFKNTAVSL